MKNQKYPTVRTVLKCKIEHHRNKVNMDTPNTHIHGRSISWIRTKTSIKSWG